MAASSIAAVILIPWCSLITCNNVRFGGLFGEDCIFLAASEVVLTVQLRRVFGATIFFVCGGSAGSALIVR